MRKIWLILFVIGVFSLMTGACSGAVVLVKDGEPAATIVVAKAVLGANPADAARDVNYPAESKIKSAVQDLVTYIEKMSGAKLPVVGDDQPVKGTVIYVGRSAGTDKLRGFKIPSGLTPERNEEGYAISVRDGIVALAGNDEGPYEGTRYAVAEFLNRLGVRWIFPGDFGEIVPKKNTVVCDDMNFVDRPAFKVRTWWCNEPADMARIEGIWKIRNKMQINGNSIICIPGDSWLRKYLPDAKLAETRPELFGKNFDQTVNPYMANLSNPETAKIVAEKIIAEVQASEKTGNRINSVGFAPDDGLPMDHTLKTMDELNQGFTDWIGREGVPTELSTSEEWFTFVNRVAEEVTKVYPDFIVVTNGYANRAIPPQGVKLHPNLGVMTAFIWQDETKPMTDPKNWHGQVVLGELKQWTSLCKRVFIYEYNHEMLVTMLTPVPQVKRTIANYREYKKLGMIGFMNETRLPYMEEGILTRYLRAHLMWNPDMDTEKFIADYYSNWYGPAAKPAADFWNAIENCILDSPLLGHEDRILGSVYTPELIASCEKSVADAEKLATEEPYRTRVRVDRLTLEHLKGYMALKEAESEGKYADAVRAVEKMIDCRMALNKISPFLSMPPSRTGIERYYAGDSYYGALDRRDYFRQLNSMTNGESGILVAMAPRIVKFTLDEAGVGKDLAWYAADFDRKDWSAIDTTKPFYIQQKGCLSENGIPYIGKMWYVFELNVPSAFAGKQVRLYAPFVTTQAWVWVNGQYAGVRKYLEAYISPAPIDLDITKFVIPGKKNVIAVWVSTGMNRIQATDGFMGRLFLYSPQK